MPSGGEIVKETIDKCILVKRLGMFYVRERERSGGTRKNITLRVNLVYERLNQVFVLPTTKIVTIYELLFLLSQLHALPFSKCGVDVEIIINDVPFFTYCQKHYIHYAYICVKKL
jgi:hypothetical protein